MIFSKSKLVCIKDIIFIWLNPFATVLFNVCSAVTVVVVDRLDGSVP